MRFGYFVRVSIAAVIAVGGASAQEPAARPAAIAPASAAPQAKPASPESPLYDEKADAREQIAAALAKAKKENQRVLIQWGGNWCGWCIKLHELCKSNREISKKLMYEYVVVHVDAGKPVDKNMALATGYGADLKQHGFPFLTILDADGKPLANQETSPLEVDGNLAAGHDPKKVLDFLTRHEAAKLDAAKTLEAGVAAAKKDGKRVFLHFGAPWCGWCHKLEDWMAGPAVAPLLAKEFVDIKIDTDRMAGGKELLDRFTGGKPGGIPWFAFLDADGKVLIDSNATPGNIGTNIGFPAKGPEVEHFMKMLKQAGQKLSADELEQIRKSLGS